MILDAYHNKKISDKQITKVMKNSFNVDKLKTAKFNFWPENYNTKGK